ncbi:MAG: HAD-superfamily hydrolase, subfamily (PSPase-like) family protein, partial [Deltaproteobacteria bacterium]|nr:HAD-superfamily hydrolase, subfamily (PSPase-like) family protein [Deltaproteobacteria bacterium]
RIEEQYDLKSFDHIYAYGDTPGDKAMLELADEKYYRWKRI